MSAELVTLSIDGKEVTVPKGTLIIRAAEQLGIEIPRFCDHPLLEPVAACRQCYVSVEGQRKLITSCSTPVAADSKVHTQYSDPAVKEAQEAVLEFLLINHPLDCPVCDRGGECPLQDQSLAFGAGESRYVEAKRTFRKPLPLSPLVNLDRERCVLCARCTRFCDEISGDRFIELFDRGAAEQVSIAPGEDFDSPFSGNTVQICPVGALTSTTYRFAARPFDLRYADTVCPHCAAGCNLRVDLRRGEVVRHLARDNYEVNDAWLCDKGRYAFSFADQDNRLTTPLLREHGLEPVSFREALDAVAGWCAGARVAVLAGGRLSDEDAYGLSKLARTVLKTNDVDHRFLGAASLDEAVVEAEAAQAAGMPVTYRDVENASVLVLVGLDAEQELPILHLRIRKAARKGAKVFVLGPRRTRLWDVAEHLMVLPGQEAAALEGIRTAGQDDRSASGVIAFALREAADGAVVLVGPRMASVEGAVASASALAGLSGARLVLLCRRANDRGALRAGLHPRLLPGGVRTDDAAARAGLEERWGSLADLGAGRDTGGILQAAADRQIDVLFLVGVDPLTDFPDAALARRALQNVSRKVVVDVVRNELSIFADVMLPAAPYLEKDGHYTDWEGRTQRLKAVRPPAGLARSEWEIFEELSVAAGIDMGFSSLEALHSEMGLLYGGHRSVESSGAGAVDARVPPRSALGPNGASPGYAPPPSAEVAQAPIAEGSLILFSYPLLVDEGRLSVGAEKLKEAHSQAAFVEVNPVDAERLSLTAGSVVRVRTGAGEASLPVRVSDGVVVGAAFVPWNQPGLVANTLLSGSLVTEATLEPAAAEVTA